MGKKSKPINVGDTKDIEEQYANLRASLYWKAREWMRMGGAVSKEIAEEMKLIKYKENIRGKIQIMSKEDMRKLGIKSPNKADAFALTFYVKIREKLVRERKFDPLALPRIKKDR